MKTTRPSIRATKAELMYVWLVYIVKDSNTDFCIYFRSCGWHFDTLYFSISDGMIARDRHVIYT